MSNLTFKFEALQQFLLIFPRIKSDNAFVRVSDKRFKAPYRDAVDKDEPFEPKARILEINAKHRIHSG